MAKRVVWILAKGLAEILDGVVIVAFLAIGPPTGQDISCLRIVCVGPVVIALFKVDHSPLREGQLMAGMPANDLIEHPQSMIVVVPGGVTIANGLQPVAIISDQRKGLLNVLMGLELVAQKTVVAASLEECLAIV